MKIVKEMILIWEKKLGHVVLSDKKYKILFESLVKHFSSSLKCWVDFVDYIALSKFLMGGVTSFQITLDWLLRSDENILKVKQGNYHSKEEKCGISKQKIDTTKHVEDLKRNSDLKPEWKKTLEAMVGEVGASSYVAWLSRLEFESEAKGILTLKAPNGFIRDHVDTHFGRKILMCASRNFEGLRKVCFTVSDLKQGNAFNMGVCAMT